MGFIHTLRRKVGSKRLRQDYLASATTTSTSLRLARDDNNSRCNGFDADMRPMYRPSLLDSLAQVHFDTINWDEPSQRKAFGSPISSIDPLDNTTRQYTQQLQALDAHKTNPSQSDFRSSLVRDDDEPSYTSTNSLRIPNHTDLEIANETGMLNTLHNFPYHIGMGYNDPPTPHAHVKQKDIMNTLHGFPYQIGAPSTMHVEPIGIAPQQPADDNASTAGMAPSSRRDSVASIDDREPSCPNPFKSISKRCWRSKLTGPTAKPTEDPVASIDFMARRLCARGFIDWFLATHEVAVWAGEAGWVGVRGMYGVQKGLSGNRVAMEMVNLVWEGTVRVGGESVEGRGVHGAFVRGLLGKI